LRVIAIDHPPSAGCVTRSPILIDSYEMHFNNKFHNAAIEHCARGTAAI
jgi:hypothetical protein